MPSAFNIFKSTNNQNRRSSSVSTDSTRSALSKSLASLSSSGTSTVKDNESNNLGETLNKRRRPSSSIGQEEGVGEAPRLKQKPKPSISTSGPAFQETPRSTSVPSIDITSPSSNQPRPLWEPGSQQSPSSPSFPAISNSLSSEEDRIFDLSDYNQDRKMPKPASSHSKYRSEPGASSKKSGKAEVLDRHDVMRRAMAEATSSDAFGNTQNDNYAEPFPTTNVAASRMVPSDSNGSVIDHGEGDHGDKIGAGSLSFDHFASVAGEGEVVHADGSATAAMTSVDPSSNQDSKAPQVSPSRPKLGSRNNSYTSESGLPEVAGYVASPAQSIFNDSQPSSAPNSANAALSSAAKKAAAHGRYATTGHTNESIRSSQASLAVPKPSGSVDAVHESKHMHESASTNNLIPSPLSRLRKLSDSGNSSKSKPAGGIAGALAASGMAGMGVGHAALLQQSQAVLTPSKEKGSRSRNSSIGADYIGGYQGGVYRDPKTGKMIEKGPGPEDEEERTRYMRSRSATGSTLSLASSDVSAASGLNAAANFSAAAAAQVGLNTGLLGPEDVTRRSNGEAPPLTPGGIGAVGGLSPSGLGERVALGEEEPWAGDMGSQITGFAVASSKRNADFHALFSSVPEDDYLIEDYGCALVREILIQGRLYVSENHVCFYANIFGWITNIVLPFSEIVSIEKRMTAYVIPNAIQIATLHSKQTFASFLSRDTTYDLIVNIWKLSHPGVPTGESAVEILTDEESMDHEGEQDGEKSKSDVGHEESAPKKSKRKLLKKKLGLKEHDGHGNANGNGSAVQEISRGKSPAPGGKKAAHRKTQCPCESEKKHYTTVALDTTYPAVPEKIYNLIFTSGFMKEFWTDNQKLLDLQMSDWAPNAQNDNMLSRNMSYIKPLSGGFGPKQTKCMLTDENIHIDFDDYVVALTTTRTPDVPSGGSFSVKTRTCFTWAGGNVTKVYVTCQVEWTGRSMVKGIIDRASIDGQKQYYKDLDVAIRAYIKDHASEFKEEGDDETAIAGQAEAGIDTQEDKESKTDATPSSEAEAKEGMAKYLDIAGDLASTIFDTLSDVVGTIADMAGGVSPSVLILGFVVFLLVVSNLWALMSSTSRDPLDPHRLRSGRQSSSRSAKSTYKDHHETDQAHVVAIAVREVLRDYFEPVNGASMVSAKVASADSQSPRLASQDPLQEMQTLVGLLDEVEERVARLREQLKSAGEGGQSSTFKSVKN